MIWFLLALTGVLFYTWSTIFDKYVISKRIPNAIVVTITERMFKIPIIFLLPFFIQIIIPPSNILLILLISGLIHFLSVFLYYKAIKKEEVSRTITLIHSLYPLFTLLIALVVLGEILTIQRYFGIFLIIIGSILISFKKMTKLEFSPALLLTILCALGIATQAVMIKYVLNYISAWDVIFWESLAVFLVTSIFIPIYRKSFGLISKDKKSMIYIAVASITAVIGYFLITFAISYQFVSLVTSVESLQPIITFLIIIPISIFIPKFLKEEIKKSTLIIKLFATIMSVIGVLLII